MSEPRPVSFRHLKSEPQSSAVLRPAWLRGGPSQIRPASFAMAQGELLENDEQRPTPAVSEEVAPREQPSFASEHHIPVRRSSLPPRRSVFPPPAMISRLPPPPPELVEAVKPSPEQEAFARATLDVAALRARIFSTAESELLSLAVHIAQVILEHEVACDPSLHRNLARTAVLALGDTQAARLRLSRTAYRAITELYGEAAIDVEGVRVEVSMDASLDALSVVAEGGPSRVDARMDERLSAVLRALQAEHRRLNAAEEES